MHGMWIGGWVSSDHCALLLLVLLVLSSCIQINVKHESEQIVIQYIYWGLDIKLSVWTRGL